ncbi:hypothetical protein ACWDE9_37175, partial [Streptomyces olivaceoviridis]
MVDTNRMKLTADTDSAERVFRSLEVTKRFQAVSWRPEGRESFDHRPVSGGWPTSEALRELHLRHLRTVPFE